MVTTCLIGCDPAVTVQPVWTNDAFTNDFLQQLRGWGDLTEIELAPGESILKISRRLLGAESFTWMGLYTYAKAFGSARKNTFIGAGFLLAGPQIVPGALALAYLDDTLGNFAAALAPGGRLTRKLVEIGPGDLPVPESAWPLDAAILDRAEPGGLRPRDGTTGGGVLFVDDQSAQMALFVDSCQLNEVFAPYHTVLIGQPPDPSERRRLKAIEVVTPEELLARRPPPPQSAEERDARGDHQTLASGRDPRRPSYVPAYDQAYRAGERRPGDRNLYRGIIYGMTGAALFFLVLVAVGTVRIRLGEDPVALPPPREAPRSGDDRAEAPPPQPDPTAPDPRETVGAYFAALGAGNDQADGRWTRRSRQDGRAARFRESRAGYLSFLVTPGAVRERPADGAVLQAEVSIEVSATRQSGSQWLSAGTVLLRRRSPDSDWYIDDIQLAPPDPEPAA